MSSALTYCEWYLHKERGDMERVCETKCEVDTSQDTEKPGVPTL